jgi:hypothetical protein
MLRGRTRDQGKDYRREAARPKPPHEGDRIAAEPGAHERDAGGPIRARVRLSVDRGLSARRRDAAHLLADVPGGVIRSNLLPG